MEPSRDPGEIHGRQALTTEMAEALAAGLRPPFGGLHDIRQHVRRASVGGVLEQEELAETVETLAPSAISANGYRSPPVSFRAWEDSAQRSENSPALPLRSRGASIAAARSSTPRAAGSRPCGERSAG